jgi:GNAT superfamily N-acetyltransferase
MVSTVPALTTATLDRVPTLAAVLARTFSDDPMIRWPFHDHDVVERSEPMFAALLGEYATLGFVVEAGDGAGVAAWIPPSSDVGLEQADAATRPAIAGLTDDSGDRYDRFWNWLESFLPTEPHWFLDMVGVEPARQGEGIGSALIGYGVDRARAEGVPAFLETGKPRNVPYYERFGFHVAHEDVAPDGGPHIWFMRLDS